MEQGISIYSRKALTETAQWALNQYPCPTDNKRLTMTDYELQILPDSNMHSSPRLHILGECKKHSYTTQIYYLL